MKASGLNIASLISSKAPSTSHSIGSPKSASRIRLPAYNPPNSQQIYNPVKPESLPVLGSRIHSDSKAVDIILPDKSLVSSQTEYDKRDWSVKYNPDIRPRLNITFVQEFVHDAAGVYSVKFSPNGHYLAIGLGSGEVIIYNAFSGLVCHWF